jgi:hypothetical protein
MLFLLVKELILKSEILEIVFEMEKISLISKYLSMNFSKANNILKSINK